MAYIPSQKVNTGQFVPTTNVLDSGSKDMMVRLCQTVNNMVLSLNLKQTGIYIEEEFVDGSVYFNPVSDNPLDLRPVFRKTVNIGALGAGATVPHGLVIGTGASAPLTTLWTFVRIYGVASDTTIGDFYPLPWASAAGLTNIELLVDATDVIIINNSGVAFTDCTVVIEYLKQ